MSSETVTWWSLAAIVKDISEGSEIMRIKRQKHIRKEWHIRNSNLAVREDGSGPFFFKRVGLKINACTFLWPLIVSVFMKIGWKILY